MRHVNETTDRVLNSTRTSCEKSPSAALPRNSAAKLKPEALAEHWVAALFARFQARYGAKWTSAMAGIEEIAVREWANALAGMKATDIERGLASWQGVWPPSAFEFRKVCMGGGEGWEHRSAAYRPFPPALPKPKAKPEVAQAELAKMRERPAMTPEEIDAARAALRGRA